jgi:alcohol dehydrogenase (cytochrome c)
VTTAQRPRAAGRTTYLRTCARCHGGDGQGGEMGPAIVSRLAARSDASLESLIRSGLPDRGMPPTPLPASAVRRLIAHLRELQETAVEPLPRVTARLGDGQRLTGTALNQSSTDLQLLTDDGRLRMLRREGDAFRIATSETDWPTYNGDVGGNRFSAIDEITRENVGRLALRWLFALPGASRLEVTPVVVDGVMYVTNANECFALDAGSGRRIWHYRRPRTRGLAGDAASGINRGVAVGGDRVFIVTDHAHLIALNRFTGALVWDTEMADWRLNYGATSAPLLTRDLVVSGTSGGDEGIRGFVAAYDQATGKEVWRFWTVPRPGEPGSETWRGKDIAHPCASAWLTGTYDKDLDTVYWPTGNPCPDYDGRERLGDNLYSDSILALDRATGRLKWYFQYTPHDLWDWDAQQPPVLVDVRWQGQPRKLLLHANRNGFMYVLDRTNGHLLLAEPFVKKLTWASRIGADGRPVLQDGQTPSADGTRVCPAVEGATNWFSTAFDSSAGLYFVQALEKCSIYTLSPERWRPGRSYYSGTTSRVPGEPGRKVLRAIDIRDGSIRWELPQEGDAESWGGVLATAGGLVFVADDSGALAAVDAETGAPLWRFEANVLWKASPMTYVFDGRQHVAIAAGPNILSFALVD